MKKYSIFPVFIALVLVLVGPMPSIAADDCSKSYPNPVIEQRCNNPVNCVENGRIPLTFKNYSAFEGLIAAKGTGDCRGRTKVEVVSVNGAPGGQVFCNLTSPSELQSVYYQIPGATIPGTMVKYTGGTINVIFLDTTCNRKYTSNNLEWSIRK